MSFLEEIKILLSRKGELVFDYHHGVLETPPYDTEVPLSSPLAQVPLVEGLCTLVANFWNKATVAFHPLCPKHYRNLHVFPIPKR